MINQTNVAEIETALSIDKCTTKEDFVAVVDDIINYVVRNESGEEIRNYLTQYRFDVLHVSAFKKGIILKATKENISEKISKVIGALSVIKREQKIGKASPSYHIVPIAKQDIFLSLARIKELFNSID